MKLIVGSSSLLSKVVFLFSVALILLVDKKNVVNATLVTTTTTTIETETTTVEEYENSPPRQDEGEVSQEYERTNDHHGGFIRGSSNINRNYDNNKYNDEANKGGVFGSSAVAKNVNAASTFLQPEEVVGRDPAGFCSDNEGAFCDDIQFPCCKGSGLTCVFIRMDKDAMSGKEIPVFECQK